MTPRPPSDPTPPVAPPARHSPPGRGAAGGRLVRPAARSGAINWSAFLRRIERKRRLLRRASAHPNGDGVAQPPLLPADYYARATHVSFRLDGHHDLAPADVRAALGVPDDPAAPDRPTVPLRSRLARRLRNHAAILHHIENALRKGLPLTADAVVRWYTTVSAGLSTNALGPSAVARLDEVVRRLNSPNLRVQAALPEVAATHVRLLTEPLVPGFNGILARLLLRYHLGRCQLPPILFDPAADARTPTPAHLTRRLVELIEQTYDELLGGLG